MVLTGLPQWAVLDPQRRWRFDSTRSNVYRDWFPVQEGYPTYKEGIDMGPDRVDAVIAPLPLPGAAPFCFGDHLWDTCTGFVEQRGIAHLRKPLGSPPDDRSSRLSGAV